MKAYRGVLFAKADMQKCKGLFQEQRVRGLPCIILFRESRPLQRFEGFTAEAPLRKAIEKHQALADRGGLLGIPLPEIGGGRR